MFHNDTTSVNFKTLHRANNETVELNFALDYPGTVIDRFREFIQFKNNKIKFYKH